MSQPRVQFLRREGAEALAFLQTAGRGPRLLWLSGFRSDMTGTKAARLHAAADRDGRAFTRFDYSGCGASTGAFADQTIGAWRADALAMLDRYPDERVILVGSSMGGWLALLAALARPAMVAGLVLIAPAPDFTERLLLPALPPEAHAALARDGVWLRPSAYGDGPYPITARLIEEARAHLVLDRPIRIACPVRILQGQADPDVPWRLALELSERLESPDVEITLVKSGDHRLSTPADLDRLERIAFGLQDEVA